VEPGNLPGVPEWDSADIEKWLTPFVGPDLRYDAHYVRVEGHTGQVLFLAIDPPKEGDPIYNLLQASEDPATGKTIPAGTIFVRHGSNTRPHTPDDLKRLGARLVVAETTKLNLAVELDTSNVKVISPNLVSDGFRNEKLRVWRAGRLAKLPKPEPMNLMIKQFASKPFDEMRTEQQFRAEVDMYVQTIESTSNAWLRIVANEWVKEKRSALGLSVKNNTDENYEHAVVEVRFFGVGRANMYLEPGEAEGVLQLPEEPGEWGESFAVRSSKLLRPVVAPRLRAPEPEIEAVGAGEVLIRYPEFRVRPHTTHRLAPIFLALAPFMAGTTIEVHWRITASNASGHQENDLEFQVPGEPAEAFVNTDESDRSESGSQV
jgi:hypothetical protein